MQIKSNRKKERSGKKSESRFGISSFFDKIKSPPMLALLPTSKSGTLRWPIAIQLTRCSK